MHHFNRAVDRQQHNFLKNYIHRRLQQSRILKFEKDVEDASATNNIRKITKRLTKFQTHTSCTRVVHSRNGLTNTPLVKVTAIAEVYGDKFRPNPEEQTFENFYRQIKTEVNTHLQAQPTDPTACHTESNFANN
jgi:hypothetical protein